MSRANIPFRPQLEALEGRFAPGSLLGTTEPASDLAALVLHEAALRGATQTTRPVVEFFNRTVVRGESTLTRTDHGITMHLKASGLEAGVYSAWIPIWHPGGTVPAVAGWVGGHVVGQGGVLNVAAHLNEGEIISGHPVLPSGSLQDALLQDIGMVIRYHGPAEPGRIYEQSHTFEPNSATDFLFTRHNAS